MEAWDQRVVFLIVYFLGSVRGNGIIRKPPTITKHPSANIIYRGDTAVTLECEAEGIPAVLYEWRKNGRELNPNQPNIEKGVDGSITIRNAAASDEGFYQCFARNQYGTALSDTAHIQRALLDSASGANTLLPKTVVEGLPFHIQADPRKSFPKPRYGWEMATNAVDKNPVPIMPSRRIQVAENGDLHFAFALSEDDLGGKIYKCTTYNHHLDVKAGGSYTKVTVTRDPTGVRPFQPTLQFASDVQTVTVVGGSVTLRCYFSGYPEPTISWSGPWNTLPIGRYTLKSFYTEFTISNVTASDEGDYICAASNTQGNNAYTLQIRVEAVPRFPTVNDGPYDVNVTEGESFTFNCNADAKPEATIVWFQDGQPLDPSNPPVRFAFSNDLKSLTIRDVCRDCVDRETKTDLMVIQCNASNVHGYAFAQEYLNVLSKTEVFIDGNASVIVNLHEEQIVQFNCSVTSDPSTLPIVRWFKVEKSVDQLIRNDPPFIEISDGTLTILFNPDNGDLGRKYLGEYKCVGDNGYSSDFNTVRLDGISQTTQVESTVTSSGISALDTTITEDITSVSVTTETHATTVSLVFTKSGFMIQDVWVWIIIATAGLVLLLLVFSVCTTIVLCKQKDRNNYAINKVQNERCLPPESIEPDYATIDDDCMIAARTKQSSLSSDSLSTDTQRDLGLHCYVSDMHPAVGGVAGLVITAETTHMRHTARNESTVMGKRRQELKNILEDGEPSEEYVALAEREPASPAVYAILEQEKEELNPVRYTTFKSPERVKRIKSWFI